MPRQMRDLEAGLGRVLMCGVSLSLTMAAAAQDLAIQTVQEQRLGGVEVLLEEHPDGVLSLELDPTLSQPGFMLPLADDDVREQTQKLNKHFAAKDWGMAFRQLSELSSDQLQSMVPVDRTGLHVTVKEQLQRQLLTLPPDGLRAFRLYFDGQAREQIDAVRSHPMPGSEEQLILAQALVDRMLASSVGGEAATLLGDLYFERGVFAQAARCWQLALEQGQFSGEAALTLQCKRAIALMRSGDQQAAQQIYLELKDRYGQATIRIGGQESDAIKLLAGALGGEGLIAQQPGAPEDSTPLALPKPGSGPAWHMTFLDLANKNTMGQSRSRYYYRGPQDLDRYIPPVAHDEERIYFHWLDAVFALDQKTGKILWNNGADAVNRAAKTVNQRMGNNAGDPRNYRIALTDDTLLVTTTRSREVQNDVFSLIAYDKHNGSERWTSLTHSDWPIVVAGASRGVCVLGEVLINGHWAYVVVQPKGSADCYLRRFDPISGRVSWTVSLGSADPMAFRYTSIKRMPQPRLLMHEGMVFVLTNNGGLVAVDLAVGEIRWATRSKAPLGVGPSDKGHSHHNQLRSQIESLANKNGAGALLLHNGKLYAKEHNAPELMAVQASTGRVLWTDDSIARDAKLVGAGKDQLYLMNRAIKAYRLGEERGQAWKSQAVTGGTEHAGAVLRDETMLVYASGQLTTLNAEDGKPVKRFENPYLSQSGGYLYLLDGLIVCVSETGMTAFRLSP